MYRTTAEEALKRGLAEMPAPEPSPGFDAAVLSACAAGPANPWRTLFASWRPTLAGAACALPVMFWLIGAVPNPAPRETAAGAGTPALSISESALEVPILTPLSSRRAAPAVTRNGPPPDRSGSAPTPAIAS